MLVFSLAVYCAQSPDKGRHQAAYQEGCSTSTNRSTPLRKPFCCGCPFNTTTWKKAPPPFTSSWSSVRKTHLPLFMGKHSPLHMVPLLNQITSTIESVQLENWVPLSSDRAPSNRPSHRPQSFEGIFLPSGIKWWRNLSVSLFLHYPTTSRSFAFHRSKKT